MKCTDCGFVWLIASVLLIMPLEIQGQTEKEENSKESILQSTVPNMQQAKSYLRLSQGVTHYELRGSPEGEVVVLIHGASLAMWVWDRQMEPLLSAGFRVLRYDQYARGFSDYLDIRYDQNLYQRQLKELLAALAIDRPVSLVVHSFGGLIGSLYAFNQPEQIHKIVFISPGVTVDPFLRLFLKSPIAGWYIRHTIKKLPQTIDNQFQDNQIPLDPYKASYMRQANNYGFTESLISLYGKALGNHIPYYEAIGKQKKGVMIIMGSQDRTIKRKHIDQARKAMPHVRYHQLNNVGHVPQFEATEKVNALLLEFLKE